MKLCIFMWYDENVSNYGHLNYLINKVYCDKYNIDLICCNKRRVPEKLPHFERVPLLLEYIHNYDYVMWIDSDAHFYIDSENIIDFINKYSSYNVIFSQDFPNHGIINSGVFIVKNTQYSIDFLNRWCYDEELYVNRTNKNWHDQSVVIDMYTTNILDIRNNSIIINYGILQHFSMNRSPHLKKPFIIHLAGTNRDDRIKHSIEYFKQNRIDKLLHMPPPPFFRPTIVRKDNKYKMKSIISNTVR